MQPSTFDLLVPVFFLCALIVAARFKRHLFYESPGGYRAIAAGVVTLAVLALVNLYENIGLLSAVPFISEPPFYRLISWIGIISGLTVLISGVSNWLVSVRTHRKHDHAQLRPLEFIKRAAQLVGVERRVPVILKQTLQYMVDYFDFRAGAVYVHSRQQGKLHVIAVAASKQVTEADVRRIIFEKGLEARLLKNNHSLDDAIIGPTSQIVPRPTLALPLMVTDRLSGLFLLWGDEQSTCTDDDRVNLKIAADIIARKIELNKLSLSDELRNRRDTWLQSLSKAVDTNMRFQDQVPQVSRWLRQMLPADLISLTILRDDQHGQRLSVGKDDSVLNEKGLPPSANRLLEHLLDHPEPLVIKDTRYKTTMPLDEMIERAGLRSLVACPLVYGNTTIGAVVIAAEQPGRFTGRETALIKSALPLLSNLVALEIQRARVQQRDRLLEQLGGFLGDCGGNTSLQVLFERTAELLSQMLKTTVVRISTYERGGTFLRSRALALTRSIEGCPPAEAHMILSLMPRHELVRNTGRHMLIDQQSSEKKINQAEARQMAGGGLKSALLVPVTVKGKVTAVISLAEMRSRDRYHYDEPDIRLANAVAAALSLAMQIQARGSAVIGVSPSRERSFSGRQDSPEARSRIKSSLAGIMGSVEIMKSRRTSVDPGLAKYLSIIDRSAQKINEYIVDEVTP